MNNNRKALIAGVLAILLVASLLAACSGGTSGGNNTDSPGGENTPSNTTSPSTSEGTANPYANKVTLTYMNTIADMSKWKDGTIVEQELEPRFNVELKALAINSTDREKISVTFAGGAIPDVIIGFDGQKHYEDGILRTISMDLVEQYMPNTLNIINNFDPEYGWSISRSYADGELFMIPSLAFAGAVKSSIIARKDWMDAVGIAKAPETIDELHEMWKRFTFDDPDNNGKDDTYGVATSLFAPPFWALSTLQGAFGVNANAWTEENGKVAYGAVTENYKQFLKLTAAWFKEGIIDPAISDSQADKDAKVVNGVLGSHFTNIQYLYSTGYKDPMRLLQEQGVDIEVLPPTKGPEGKSGGFTFSPYFGWGMMFGVHATDEQVIRAMQIADAAAGDIELLKLMKWGKEGVTYDITEDGMAVIKPEVDAGEHGLGLFFNHIQVIPPVATLLHGATAMEAMKRNIETVPYTGSIINGGALQAKFNGNLSVQFAEMDKLVSEFFSNAITGKVNIDQEWDAYVRKWNDMGGALATEEAQNMPRLNSNWTFDF